MKKTVLRLKRETSNSLRQVDLPIPNLGAYLMTVSVESAFNIDSEVFVMQRDVQSSYVDGYVDTFYSIASVGELAFLPIGAPSLDSTNFFRVSSVEMMFETPKDLETAWQKISAEVLALAEANDLSINTVADIVAIYPSDAFLRYYGASLNPPNAQQIQALTSDSEYSNKLSTVLNFGAGSYFTFAYPGSLGSGELKIDEVAVGVNISSINLTTKYEQIIPYKVYTTQNQLTVGLHTIKFSST